MHQEFSTIEALLTYIRQTSGSSSKGICELGQVPPALAARIQQCIGLDTNKFQLTLDSYGIRHAFVGHSQDWGSRDQHPLTEADVLALPTWVFTPASLFTGAALASPSQLQRLQFEHPDTDQRIKTVLILEIRPRHRRVVFVTMYKTKNG